MTDLYVGCYTEASPIGLHRFEVSPGGVLTSRSTVDTVEQASFVTIRPDTATLYAVRETADTGALVAMRTGDGAPTPIDEVPSHGAAPCHVSTRGDRAYVANYGSGTVAAYALRSDGTFGESIGRHQHVGSGPHGRQEAPHAHCIVPGPDGVSVYATDLGTDRIVRYTDTDGGDRLEYADETVMAPGTGPRHLTFHPTWPIAFVVCELDCTLVVADVDPDTGRLHPRTSISTLPDGTAGESIAAEVAIHPDGQRIYVSNRGHDSIATFAIDAPGASPELVEHVPSGGRTPRHIAVHPSGRLLLAAHQDSDTIVSFEVDGDGVPRQTGITTDISQPVCLAFAGADR